MRTSAAAGPSDGLPWSTSAYDKRSVPLAEPLLFPSIPLSVSGLAATFSITSPQTRPERHAGDSGVKALFLGLAISRILRSKGEACPLPSPGRVSRCFRDSNQLGG